MALMMPEDKSQSIKEKPQVVGDVWLVDDTCKQTNGHTPPVKNQLLTQIVAIWSKWLHFGGA